MSELRIEDAHTRQANALIKYLIGRGEQGTAYGHTTAGKTFWALDLATHIALDRGYHGKVKRAPVLYVCLEDVPGFQNRMIAAREVLGDPGDFFARLVPRVLLNKTKAGEAGTALIIKAAKELEEKCGEPVGLIVIDTKQKATAGDNENTQEDATIYSTLRVGRIKAGTGATVMTVHHPNQAGNFRGSNVLPGDDDFTFRIDRVGDRRTLIAEKVKNGVEQAVFDFELVPFDLGVDDDGDPVSTCTIKTRPPLNSRRNSSAKQPKVPKGERFLRLAFANVERSGRASVADVKAEFVKHYPTAESGESAAQTRGKAFRRAVTEQLPVDLKIEIVDGVEFLVRSDDPLDMFEAQSGG